MGEGFRQRRSCRMLNKQSTSRDTKGNILFQHVRQGAQILMQNPGTTRSQLSLYTDQEGWNCARINTTKTDCSIIPSIHSPTFRRNCDYHTPVEVWRSIIITTIVVPGTIFDARPLFSQVVNHRLKPMCAQVTRWLQTTMNTAHMQIKFCGGHGRSGVSWHASDGLPLSSLHGAQT